MVGFFYLTNNPQKGTNHHGGNHALQPTPVRPRPRREIFRTPTKRKGSHIPSAQEGNENHSKTSSTHEKKTQNRNIALVGSSHSGELPGRRGKRGDANYTAGRPNSGGPQLKFKFHETASFIVTKVNGKRSVSLMLFDGDKVIPVGNVTIPPNHTVPQVGAIVETRYLYAYLGGSIFQPVYLGVRDDIRPGECQLSQLKYKAEPACEAAA